MNEELEGLVERYKRWDTTKRGVFSFRRLRQAVSQSFSGNENRDRGARSSRAQTEGGYTRFIADPKEPAGSPCLASFKEGVFSFRRLRQAVSQSFSGNENRDRGARSSRAQTEGGYTRFIADPKEPAGSPCLASFLLGYCARQSFASQDRAPPALSLSAFIPYPVAWPHSVQRRALTGMAARHSPQVIRPSCSTGTQLGSTQ